GVADYIQPKEDIEVKVSKFFAKVNSPVMTGIELDMGGVQADLVYPRNISDLFRGDQITIIGRYKNDSSLNTAVIKLTGTFAGKRQTFTYNGLDFPERAEANTFSHGSGRIGASAGSLNRYAITARTKSCAMRSSISAHGTASLRLTRRTLRPTAV